jgi:hypothetical protein
MMTYVGVRPRLAHLGPELGKRGSYSATYGPHETRTQTRLHDRKPLFRWHLRVVLMALEGVLTVMLLLIVEAAVTLALG